MQVYNYTDVCHNLSKLLDEARKNKNVMIKSKTGELFVVQLAPQKGSAYNLPNIDLGLSRDEIINYIKEVRER